ncbi:MAG TPA: ribonuclease HIII [Verrucomicrobiae bacterium]|nr:ribonuclease HIII [Verrucomicrobiae bacterium]
MAERTSYTCLLPADKIPQLKADLKARGYMFRDVPYAHFGAEHRGEKVNIALYTSGKLVVQGRGTTDFIQFYLEPILLGEARLGYEHILDPTMLQPRIGVDESGKGDFFGPLVVAGVYLDEAAARNMMEIGVRDSKLIKSDARIADFAKRIRGAAGAVSNVVPIGPEAYNRLHTKMRNVNDILGWGHARVIENLLTKVDCPKAISDQFGNKNIILRALMERGKKIELVQRHKAESDLAVAAASIIARDEFVRRLRRLGKEVGVDLPKGASTAVEEAAREIVNKHGADALATVAKMHFRTAQKALQGAQT